MPNVDSKKSNAFPLDRKSRSAVALAVPTLINTLIDSQNDLIAAGRQAAEATFRFAMNRLEAQQDFFARLPGATSMNDLSDLQTAFWGKATADYAGEMEAVSQSLRSVIEALRPGVPKEA